MVWAQAVAPKGSLSVRGRLIWVGRTFSFQGAGRVRDSGTSSNLMFFLGRVGCLGSIGGGGSDPAV